MGSLGQQQEEAHKYHHFLLVTMPAPGQINPARHLAHQLVQISGVHVTIATPTYSHRRMFPQDYKQEEEEDSNNRVMINDEEDGLVSYAAYSDGYDSGFNVNTDDANQYLAQLKLLGSQTLRRLACSLTNRGRPVTCVVYTIATEWAADVAEGLRVPSVLYWIQPAAAFAIFYCYFQQGYGDLISELRNNPSFAVNLPGLPPLQKRDLPPMLYETDSQFLNSYKDIMSLQKKQESSSHKKPTVLINTFHELEADAISATASDGLDLITVGPLVSNEEASSVQGKRKDLFEQDSSDYMEWLDEKEKRSVVYISFGSLAGLSKPQMEEILKGLKESGRPYLWVVRRDVREKLGEIESKGSDGMVVEWCDQVRVLSHRSVGCFVTHGGWNSTMESIVCGVPMVVLPWWVEQTTNAKMVEGVWGVGVRAEVNGEGVMEGGELKRCLDVVMGGEGFRKKAEMWKDKASDAAGSRNSLLSTFVDSI